MSRLALSFNPVAREISPLIGIRTKKSCKLTRFSSMSCINRTISDARTVISNVHNYFVKLSRQCITWLPLKRTAKATILKAFMWSVTWRLPLAIMTGANTCKWVTFAVCLFLELWPLQCFKICWICHCATLNDTSPTRITCKMMKLFMYCWWQVKVAFVMDKSTSSTKLINPLWLFDTH